MELKDNKAVIPVIVATVIVLAEVILFNIPAVKSLLLYLRWYRLGNLTPFHLVGGAILLIFAFLLTWNMIKRKGGKNLLHISLSFYLGALMFLWSGFIDSYYYDIYYPDRTGYPRAIHDSLWTAFFAMFVFVFYLYLEYQETDHPPMGRIITVLIGVTPAFLAGLFGFIEGQLYIGNGTLYGFALNAFLMLLGMVNASIFGVMSYYKSLNNVVNKNFVGAAQIQFASLYGLSLSLIIFAINNAVGYPLYISFPILLITFLSPLIMIYLKDPNYVSTLATPLYELLIVNDIGSTIYGHKFIKKGEDREELIYLKGGLISAISTVFQEVTDTSSSVNSVELEDRVINIQPISVLDTNMVIALISLKTCHYLRNSLQVFADEVKQFLIKNPEWIQNTTLRLPDELTEIVSEIFY